MKSKQKIIYVGVILLLTISFVGCGKSNEAHSDKVENQTEVNVKDEPTEASKGIDENAPSEEETSDAIYSFEVSNETFTEGTRSLDYPQLINTNIPKADDINASIYSDFLNAVADKNISINPEYITSMSSIYNTYQYNNVLLSIGFLGNTYVEEFDISSSFFIGQNIFLGTGKSIRLSDLFTCDENFLAIVKYGMYTPYTDNINLESDGVNIFEMIAENYSDQELIDLFRDNFTDFILTDNGFFISIPVPQEFGDHIDLALNYEWLESSMLRDSIVWNNYMFLDDSEGGNANDSDSGFAWTSYYNEAYGIESSYPDIFDVVEENPNGEGVWLESTINHCTLYIWAEKNTNGATGDNLLEDAEAFSQVLEENSDESSYYIKSSNYDTEGNAHEAIECCLVNETTIVRYRLDYLAKDVDQFMAVNEKMASDLVIYEQ